MTAFDVAIVGAGPAGLSAAIAAAEAGGRVAVVDENSVPGGRLLGQLHQESKDNWWVGQKVAAGLAERAAAAGVELFRGREVWGMHPGWSLALDGGDTIAAPHVVLASGAAERAVPIPGWTLPGVMTVGAAQTLTNFYRVRPGQRTAVVGVDPLSLTVAHELKLAGADVVGIFLPPLDAFSGQGGNPGYNLGYLSGLAGLAPNAFLRVAAGLVRHSVPRKVAARLYPASGVPVLGVPLKLKQSITAIEGDERVRAVEVTEIDAQGRPKGRTRSLEVDCVCLSGGLYPVQELTSGCDVARIDELGGQVPLHSAEMETTLKNVFVAGNITGIEGANVAMAQGTVAGLAVAARLGLAEPARLRQAIATVDDVRRTSPITFLPHIGEGRRKAGELWAATGTDQQTEAQAWA